MLVTLLCIHGNHEERPEEICSYEELLWHDGIVYGERKKECEKIEKEIAEEKIYVQRNRKSI